MNGEYCTTLPELAKEAAKNPYGGITGRPRKLGGYLILPDGRRYFLGDGKTNERKPNPSG